MRISSQRAVASRLPSSAAQIIYVRAALCTKIQYSSPAIAPIVYPRGEGMPLYNLTPAAFLVALLFCASVANVRAQQPDVPKSGDTYEAAIAKAQADCAALWADHNLDPLRDKVPLGEDNKPTPAMLANPERLRAEDKPVADLAIKTLGQCRQAWGPARAQGPPAVNLMIEGVQRKQDALIADFYSGKITWGDFNAALDRLVGEFEEAVSSTQSPPAPPAAAEKSAKVIEPITPPPANQNTPATSASRGVRVALVIGDSNYSNLPKLGNPANDARAIAELLQKIGFTVRLVPDASEANLRREVRKFASESAKADIAFVFYAGHGAQIGGQNYVLPVDMDIPQTEADIAFTGLKVDDLVNSIRAKTKIVFLDACRDNPALFANLVKGRGSYPKGLAPAVGSNFEQANPGGGVFIAYATDSGSVALDGQGEHSPFTQALLRNLDKPISIDDMFSLVTREVRLVTKNAQRPYKYASLENIVCLTGSCSSTLHFADTDIVQEAQRSEAEDLQIALQMNSFEALETYLQKYPESGKQSEILNAIATRKRSEFDDWVLYEIGPPNFPAYLKLNSMQQFGDRVAVRTKFFLQPKAVPAHPDAVYMESNTVLDCKKRLSAFAEATTFGKKGKVLFHYKWANPEFLDMATGFELKPGMINHTLLNIVCYEQNRSPLVTRKELAGTHFTSVSSTVDGTGEVFFIPSATQREAETTNLIDTVIVFKMYKDTKLLPPAVSLKDPLTFRTEVDRVLLRCDRNESSRISSEYYDASNNLVYKNAKDYSQETIWHPHQDKSPFAVLQRMVCRPKEAQQ